MLGDLVSMGTLLAFATVCIGVLVLRQTKPGLPRAFGVPMAPSFCALGASTCLWSFMRAFEDNGRWMIAWIIVGLLIYFGTAIAIVRCARVAPDISELHLAYALWRTPLVEAGVGGEHRLLVGLGSTQNCNGDSARSCIHEYAAAGDSLN